MSSALTMAIVALPLSMAIAVASGVSPERGLYPAIVGGFLVSALGGSRYQIGGPVGAFIVLVAATAARFGLNGLFVTVIRRAMPLSTTHRSAKRGSGFRMSSRDLKGIPCPILTPLAESLCGEWNLGLRRLIADGFGQEAIECGAP